MLIKRSHWPEGQVVELEYTSKALAANPLGDPATRKLHVWLPPGYHTGASKRRSGKGARLPVLYDLVGFTGSGRSHTNWLNFGENLPERAARLIHEDRMGPVILVFPDCFTAYGGNQYVNSSAIGNYADYLVDELVPFVDREFRTLASREHRGCFGKSSGGYGAIYHGMHHPKTWGAIADHSGDAYFDFVYRTDWPKTLDVLDRYAEPRRSDGPIDVAARAKALSSGRDDGRVRRFIDTFWKGKKASNDDVHALMIVCMAATYDPDPRSPNGFRLPFNLETGELLEKRWKHWLKFDPIHMVKTHQDALRSLRAIWIDCGWSDQYFIHYGARRLSLELARAGIEHVYEEFGDNHSSIDYRMDRSLPYLYAALKP